MTLTKINDGLTEINLTADDIESAVTRFIVACHPEIPNTINPDPAGPRLSVPCRFYVMKPNKE